MASSWGNSWASSWGNSWGALAATTETIARPSGDTTAGTWLPSTGAVLWDMLDEVTPDDADYIYTNTMGVDCELPLTSTVYPGGTNQVLKFRASSPSGNNLQVVLLNTGGSVIKTVTQALTPTDSEYSITLSSAEIAAITSGDVSVRLRGI